MRAEPLGVLGRTPLAFHGVLRDDAAVADLPGEARVVRAEQRLSHAGVNAVGADDHIRLHLAAVLEMSDRHAIVRRHIRAPSPESDAPGGEGGRDHIEQVSELTP